jgi:8-oxo-dGTP diphosphatase
MSEIPQIVQKMLRSWGARWGQAADAQDHFGMEDMPALPGDVSIGAFTDFIKQCHVYLFPRPCVTVDIVIFGLDMTSPPVLNVLLIRRGRPGTAFEGHWALPGGFVDKDEDLAVAALRELREETHAEPSHIEQLATFGKPGRDPRGHVVSVAYMALLRTNSVTIQGDDAAEAAWWPVDDLHRIDLAFDHKEILATAIKRLRSKLRWQPIGIDLLPETFTLTELQAVYETVLGRTFDKRNFRKKVLSYGALESAESVRIGGSGRPPELFRFDRTAYEILVEEGEAFEV